MCIVGDIQANSTPCVKYKCSGSMLHGVARSSTARALLVVHVEFLGDLRQLIFIGKPGSLPPFCPAASCFTSPPVP